MNSTYKGDSPNKKMVRALAWLHAIDVMKEFHQEPVGAYVLAGHGGDIRSLKGAIDYMYPRESDFGGKYPLTKHPERWLHRPAGINITAVDYDQQLIDQLHKNVNHICKEPESGIGEINGYVGDAARLANKAGRYNLSHMDFCNATSVENIYTVGEVIRKSSGLSYHLVTVMRGREPGLRRHDVLVPNLGRAERKRWRNYLEKTWAQNPHRTKVASRILTRGSLDIKSAIKEVEEGMRAQVSLAKIRGAEQGYMYFKKDGSLTPYATGVARATIFGELLSVMLHDTHVISLIYNDAYHSNSKCSRGTPFATFGILALPIKDCFSIPGVVYHGDTPKPSYSGAVLVMQRLSAQAKCMSMSSNNTALYHGTKECEKTLRINACLLAMRRGTQSAADLLCLEKPTVVAWKAHASRGSYGDWLKDLSRSYMLPFGHPDRPKSKWWLPADKSKHEF